MTSEDLSRIDTSVAHPARRYNYWLGGKDYFQADRESGDAIANLFPTVRAAALANRAFLGRAVRFLVARGVRQFLDIGTGIPAPGNTHDVAQVVAPESRVVYVDNDPIVMSHARALLNGSAAGRTAYLEADLRDWEEILGHPRLVETIDLERPVGVLLVAILHFIPPEEDPYGIVTDLMNRMVPGSYLVLSHATADFAPPMVRAAMSDPKFGSIWMRSHAEVARFAEGLDLVEPGVVSVSDWRAEHEPGPRLSPEDTGGYGFVAYKG